MSLSIMLSAALALAAQYDGPKRHTGDLTCWIGHSLWYNKTYIVYRTRQLSADEFEAVRDKLAEQRLAIGEKLDREHNFRDDRHDMSCGDEQYLRDFIPVGVRSWESRPIDPFLVAPLDYKPKSRRLTIFWRGHDGVTEGYQSAQIELAYTFLQCAGEIQLAYGIDRASFKASRNYRYRTRAGEEVLTEVDPPPAPSSIHLVARVFDDKHARNLIANVDDRFAGETLGMGCFDGQTRKLGTVAKLVGPGATPEKVKSYLAGLVLEVAGVLTPPLTRAGVAGAASAALRAEERRLAAEAAVADAKKVDETNAGALEQARRAGREIEDRMAAGRKAQADYDAAVERTRRETAAITADNARRKAAYDARAATHAACVAGDQAACARYNAGQ